MNYKCRFRKEAHPKGNPKEGIGFWGWVICLRFRSPKAALAASCTRCGLSRRLAYWPSLPRRVPALWLCGCYVIVLYCLTFCTLGSLFGLPFVHAVEQLEWCLARANVERNPKSPTCPAYNPRSSCGRDAICSRAERTSSQFHIRFWACDLTAGSQDKGEGGSYEQRMFSALSVALTCNVSSQSAHGSPIFWTSDIGWGSMYQSGL